MTRIANVPRNELELLLDEFGSSALTKPNMGFPHEVCQEHNRQDWGESATGQSRYSRNRPSHPHPNPLPQGEGVCWLVFMVGAGFKPAPTYPCQPSREMGMLEAG